MRTQGSDLPMQHIHCGAFVMGRLLCRLLGSLSPVRQDRVKVAFQDDTTGIKAAQLVGCFVGLQVIKSGCAMPL